MMHRNKLLILAALLLMPSNAPAQMTRADLIRIERARVLTAAQQYLREKPVTITAFRAERSAGGLHDFFSEGDYWWPNPLSADSPYIQRDGETNPDNFVAHRDAMRRMSQIVPALVAAYAITGDKQYARQAGAHLQAWFVDTATMMNPSLLYAQAIKGRVTGRGIGIIDTIHLVEVAQAIMVLEEMGYLQGEALARTKRWFADYLAWMTSHKYGIDEGNATNNHRTSWVLQVAEFAKLTGNEEKLALTRRMFTEKLIGEQMAPDGSFPRELGRTKPYGYSLFNLDVLAMVAQVLSTPQDNLWTFTTPDGRGMRKALAFMYPYIKDKSTWPKPPDVMYFDQWPVRQPALFFGGRALKEPNYIALWQTLNADPTVDEVIRNYPVRQPLLWVGEAATDATRPGLSIYHTGWIDHNKNGRKDPYEDSALGTDARVADLLRQMTIEEKAAQMTTLYGFGNVLMDELPTPAWRDSLWHYGIANIDEHLSGRDSNEKYRTRYSWPPSAHARALNDVQRFFIEDTRLGIPADFTMEGIRGIAHEKATSFPAQIGVGSSWDLDLISQIGHVTGREARALGYTNVYSPILDIARDPRWGRTVETYTEDPWLAARYGVAQIKALQAEGVASTPKHFGLYSIPVGGRDGPVRRGAQATWREVMEVHLAPFRAAFKEAGALGTMVTYADYDGIPIGASKLFLIDILRKEFGFQGYTVSDSGVQDRMNASYAVAPTFKDAVRQAVEAGVDVWTDFMPPATFMTPLLQLVHEGQLSDSTIDARVRNVLGVKFRLGLFDRPYIEQPEASDRIVASVAHQQLALRAARESIVLLKNQGGLLPLRKDLRAILVVGPNADEDYRLQSRYGPQRIDAITVLEGIRAAVQPGTRVSYLKGVDIKDAQFPESDVVHEMPAPEIQRSIAEAAQAARAADVAIVVVGENSEVVGESHSRISLDLPGYQQHLVEAIQATGTPTVVVLLNGRPLSINWIDKHVPAIMEAWFPGQWAGRAVADILFGDFNPGGKLAITFPRSAGQIPLNFPHKVSTEGREPTRVTGPLYPFGYGLSYTTFKYDNLRISPPRQVPAGRVEVSFDLTNTGSRAGDEVVQLYVHDVYASVTPYEKLLRGFQRVSLAAGETRGVRFSIDFDDLRFLDRNLQWTVEPGAFDVLVGSSSEDVRLRGQFEILAGRQPVPGSKSTNVGGM